MLKCEQCAVLISETLASSLKVQTAKLTTEKKVRLVCVSCFSVNGFKYYPKKDEAPLSATVREELAHKPKKEDMSTKDSTILTKLKEVDISKLPTDKRKRARYDLSKRGRIGRPNSLKVNGESLYECPQCGEPCTRTREYGKSLDDVVEHLLSSGCFEAFESKY